MEDASRTDPDFLVEMCVEMSKRGIERISLPDTVGIMRPTGMHKMVTLILGHIDEPRLRSTFTVTMM